MRSVVAVASTYLPTLNLVLWSSFIKKRCDMSFYEETVKIKNIYEDKQEY